MNAVLRKRLYTARTGSQQEVLTRRERGFRVRKVRQKDKNAESHDGVLSATSKTFLVEILRMLQAGQWPSY